MKSIKSDGILSACQIRAARLNKLEHHRLQHNVNFMRNDLRGRLAHLQRQVQGLKNHYGNVVRVVKPNTAYKSWKQAYPHEIEQDEINIPMKQTSKLKVHQQAPSPNEIPSEPIRPLLVLLDNGAEKPAEPIINLNGSFFRPKTSPVNKHVPTQHRINPLLKMFDGHSVNSNNHIQEQSSDCSSGSFLPSVTSTSSRKSIITQKMSNLDAVYRIGLQNQTAYQSVEQTRIGKRKLFVN